MKYWLPALGVLFVGLKLTGYITWSWAWVLLPFYFGIAFVLGLLVVSVIGLAGLASANRIIGLMKGPKTRAHGRRFK